MNSFHEAKELAHNIIRDIESDKKELHLLCLQSSRLALLLNNQSKSKYFYNLSEKSSAMESFIVSYGPFIDKLVQKIDLNTMYDLENPLSLSLEVRQIIECLGNNSSDLRDPQKDIQKYNEFKEKYGLMKSEIYEYAMNIFYQLEFTENVMDILSEYRHIVDNRLPELLSGSKEKLDSISKNLHSQNQEDWSNAVHTCRKLLQDLADNLYPPSNVPLDKNGRKTGPNNYINRLINYIDSHAKSEKFKQITGSNIKFIGERLDAIYKATNKGTHETIDTLEEAKRYVIHTYLFIGDILSLKE